MNDDQKAVVKVVAGVVRELLEPLRAEVQALKANNAHLLAELGRKAERGESGQQGPPGPAGKDGAVGARGEAGALGMPGPRGEPGDRGERGEPGPRGEKGAEGLAGERGAQGVQGKDGAAGLAGSVGARGEAGKDGAVGARGEPGEVGRAGERGERGERGLPGDRGDSGRDGREGKDGAPGEHGRDAAQIDVLEGFVEGRTYARGTWATRDGGVWRCGANNDWRCVMDGVKDLTHELLDDGRAVRTTTSYSSGRKSVVEHKLATVLYKAVWKEAEAYVRGDCVTWGGSMWIAVRDAKTGERPGESDAWRLAVKQGRPGRSDAPKNDP